MVQASEETEQQDLPAALCLLKEMNSSVLQVTGLVDSMLVRVKSGEITTDKGLSFLEMKYHMLLSYLIDLTYIVLRKCSGETIEADPSIDRLIEIRTVLEKIHPIDTKLKYQIDKVVKNAITGVSSENNPNLYRAHPENLVSKLGEEGEEDSEGSADEDSKDKDKTPKVGVYVPPKVAAMHYADNETKAEREGRQTDRNRRRALNSSVMRELRDEFTDSPLEISSGSRHHLAVSKFEQEKTDYEENYLTRLPLTKSEKHKKRKVTTIGTLGDEITSFGDYSALDESGTSSSGKKKKRKSTPSKKGSKKKRFF